jgi:hypothetical protein
MLLDVALPSLSRTRIASFKGEYLYMDLGNQNYATALITDDGALPGTNVANVDLKIHTVRIGLNYRFGGYGYGAY